MSKYDFKSLSSQDFEELTRDLLQASWQRNIESFKSGKDNGIDLRYTSLDGNETIIQCKHYISSGYDLLKTKIKVSEIPKIQKLSPSRYVLVTSVGLSPGNKAELMKICYPYIKIQSDIIGQDDLNNLLVQHPHIEQNTYKLWLTSKAVLDKVIHNASLIQSEFQIEKIINKLPLYVQTASLNKARKIFENFHFLMISGIPGIGKTTLAEILLFSYVEQDYRPVKIVSNINEAFSLFNPEVKQIFYYDDFLGQTILNDKLGKNEDSAILDFIELVRGKSNSRFILTTREYILQNAKQTYEKISRSGLETGKYILKLDDYNKSEKARILYNHLFFSRLPHEYIQALLKDNYYIKLIDHPNYSPRIIEWMTSMDHVQHTSSENYPTLFKDNLDFPQSLWDHAFSSQIGTHSQILLLTLYSLGDRSRIDIVQEAFIQMQKQYKHSYNINIRPGDYSSSLKELEGTFTMTDKHYVSFNNPSVKDFIESKIVNDTTLLQIILEAALLFSQIESIYRLTRDSARILHTSSPLIIDKQLLICTLRQHVNSMIYRQTVIGGDIYITKDTKSIKRALSILTIMDDYKDSDFLPIVAQAIKNILNVGEESIDQDDIKCFRELALSIQKSDFIDNENLCDFMKSLELVYRQLLEQVSSLDDIPILQEIYDNCGYYWELPKDCIKSTASEYIESELEYECESLIYSFDIDNLISTLGVIGVKYGLEVDDKISQMEGLREELLENEDQFNRDSYDEYQEAQLIKKEQERDIEEMFNTLLDI
ncbi:MAG: restriction endonuclease [Dehalococcoidales bacterium]|nr:restriction endonuclease [Dehalococcoidales bacterium]